MDESPIKEDSVHEWDVIFHGCRYIITAQVTSTVLSIEAESYQSGDRWSAEFTSQYVEEITHKAGSYKKFLVFVKMLMSAFSKANDNVFVDVLTYSDLEQLKARKVAKASGNDSMASSTSTLNTKNITSTKNQQKRYVILTYSGEFDRVHYPLPLSLEETPNADALKRTIRRLRSQLEEKAASSSAPSSEKERELRQAISLLRQDNTELRHRLRQLESRVGKASAAGGFGAIGAPGSNGGVGSGAAPGGTIAGLDAAAINAKLHRQVGTLRTQLDTAATAFSKLRAAYLRDRELLKRLARAVPGTVIPVTLDLESGLGAVGESATGTEMAALRARVVSLERELRAARTVGMNRRSSTPSGASARGTESDREHSASDRARRSFYESLRNQELTREKEYLTRAREDNRARRRSLSNPAPVDNRAGSPSIRTYGAAANIPASTNGAKTRYASPTGPPGNLTRASSLGFGRFDPTEYQRQKAERDAYRAAHAGAWGAGPGKQSGGYDRSHSRGRGESGYASATSQSSAGSRASRRSTHTEQSTKSNVSRGGGSKGKSMSGDPNGYSKYTNNPNGGSDKEQRSRQRRVARRTREVDIDASETDTRSTRRSKRASPHRPPTSASSAATAAPDDTAVTVGPGSRSHGSKSPRRRSTDRRNNNNNHRDRDAIRVQSDDLNEQLERFQARLKKSRNQQYADFENAGLGEMSVPAYSERPPASHPFRQNSKASVGSTAAKQQKGLEQITKSSVQALFDQAQPSSSSQHHTDILQGTSSLRSSTDADVESMRAENKKLLHGASTHRSHAKNQFIEETYSFSVPSSISAPKDEDTENIDRNSMRRSDPNVIVGAGQQLVNSKVTVPKLSASSSIDLDASRGSAAAAALSSFSHGAPSFSSSNADLEHPRGSWQQNNNTSSSVTSLPDLRLGGGLAASEVSAGGGRDDDISEIDRRILALQSYLDNARLTTLSSS